MSPSSLGPHRATRIAGPIGQRQVLDLPDFQRVRISSGRDSVRPCNAGTVNRSDPGLRLGTVSGVKRCPSPWALLILAPGFARSAADTSGTLWPPVDQVFIC